MGYELRSVRLYEVGKELVVGFVGVMIADGFGTLRSTQRRRLTASLVLEAGKSAILPLWPLKECL